METIPRPVSPNRTDQLAVKKLAITLVIVLGLLVAADFGAAATAEYQVSKKMRSELQLAEDPSVRINGFPFLSQAIMGDFRDVELEAKAVKVGQLSEVGVEANLRHARVSAGQVIGGNADRIPVDEVVGRVKLKASDVGRFIGITDLNIIPAPKEALDDNGENGPDSGQDASVPGEQQGAPGTTVDRTKTTVQLDGSVNIAGEDTKVRVIAVLSLLNGQLKIEPRKLDITTGTFGDIPLPDVFERSVLQQFTSTLDPGVMPFRVTPTAVGAERGVLIVEGSAKNVVIGAQGVNTG